MILVIIQILIATLCIYAVWETVSLVALLITTSLDEGKPVSFPKLLVLMDVTLIAVLSNWEKLTSNTSVPDFTWVNFFMLITVLASVLVGALAGFPLGQRIGYPTKK